MESPVEGVKMQLMNGQVEELRESYSDRPSSPSIAEGVSGTNEYQRVSSSSDYQSGPVEYQSTPSSEYQQPTQEYHTGQQEYQEYQSATEYQASHQEYQSIQPEYHPLPLQPPPPPRSPAYGSPTRGVPLRRSESRTFVPAPPQQRPGSPLNFQPQNFQRPPPNNYRPSGPQPPNQPQHFRPQLQRRAESPTQNQDYQRVYINQPDKKPLNFNPVPRDSQVLPSQPQSPKTPQPPPIPRQAPPQNIVRRPNPWVLLKQKLPADVRQQFVPIRRPQFEGRPMQPSDQNVMQRPPGDGQTVNTGLGRGSPNPGMQSPNPGMQSPPNMMYNGRPPSGNNPQKFGTPMQRPMPQEGRESPSPLPPQGIQRVMSGGDRRQPFDMQRNDSVRSMEPRGMNPQSGMFSPNPPRPMGERGRETPPGPPRTPKDDDDDVVYSSVNDPRMNRAHTPTMRPPSGPRPGLPPDLNSSPRPLSRTESRQSFEVRGPSGLDNRGEPKLIPRESPLARPLSSDMVKTPFQYRPDSQSTPPLSPKPDFQSSRPQSISPQDSLDRQRIESRSITPNNSPMTPKPTPDLRQASRSDDSKSDSGKLTPANGEDNRTSPAPPADQTNKTGPSGVGPEKPPSVLSGSVSPIPKSNDPSRITTPLPVGKDNQQSDQLNSKSPDISQNSTPISVKGNESTAGTPLPEKDSGSHSREDTPSKTPDISENFDHSNKTERPKSLKRSPSLKQDLGNNSDNEGRKTPLVRTPSRTSSAGKGNDPRSPLQRKPSGKRPKTPKTPDGDHDSGVDESTQRKDGPTTNGLSSPSKSPSKIPAPKKLSTLPSPTKSSKNSPKTPEAPPTAEKKKVPMNKIQVGAAPSPNLKTVKSKIGSLQNATHKPGGGNVKIEHRKLDWKAEPRIAAKNDAYQPGGGDKKIPQVKLKWEAKPKVGSLDNATHKPGGGEKKIESVKLDFKDKAKPKVGSKDNLKHTPGGGNVKTPSQDGSQDGNPADIEDQKLEVKAQSKIGSLDNVKHKPGGGDRKIFDDKEYLRQMSGCTSRAASEGIPSGTQDGWRSASASRRTSRDQQTCGDRRYRSESRLGLRTPEPRMGMSPREHEHCSLWDKHDQETKALVQEEESPEIKTPDLVTPVKETRPQENTIAELTSEGKDLNSNQPIENINAIEANFTITPKPDNISTCVDKAAKQEGKENIEITEQKRQDNGDTKDTQNNQHDNKGLTAATVSKPLEIEKNKQQDSKSLKTDKEDNFIEIATTDVKNTKEIANKKNDQQGSATNVNKPQEVEEKSKVKNNTSLAERIKLQDSSSHVDKSKLQDSTSHVDKSKLQDSTSHVDKSKLQDTSSHVDKSKLQDSTSHVDKSKLQDSTSHVDTSKLQDSTSHVDKSKLQDNTSHVDKSKLQDSTSSKTEKGDKLSETAKTGSVKNTTEITEQNQNVYKKLESKEDTVKEIKEIDCKEAVGNINVSNSPDSGVSISSGNVNNQNRVDGNMMQSDVNTLFPKPGTKQM